MKLVHPRKIIYLSKVVCSDCVPLILSFVFKTIKEHQRTLLGKIHSIFKNGMNRNKVDKTFYRIWDNPSNDSIWIHQYIDTFHIYISNFNCVKCGNYEVPFEPTIMHNSIICTCDTFCELYDDLTT
jgi:hypothetical protein